MIYLGRVGRQSKAPTYLPWVSEGWFGMNDRTDTGLSDRTGKVR